MKNFLVKVKEFFVNIFNIIREGLGFIIDKIEYVFAFIWKHIVNFFVFIKRVYFSEKFRVVRVEIGRAHV